MYAHMLTDRSD